MGDASPIAVVGMGGLFPNAPTLETYWRNIVGRVDATREVPAGRWSLDPRDLLDSEGGWRWKRSATESPGFFLGIDRRE